MTPARTSFVIVTDFGEDRKAVPEKTVNLLLLGQVRVTSLGSLSEYREPILPRRPVSPPSSSGSAPARPAMLAAIFHHTVAVARHRGRCDWRPTRQALR